MIRKLGFLAVALGALHVALPAGSHGTIEAAAFYRDNSDGDEGEGEGVVDPVPQDDGSDGVDDGSGDGS